MSSTNFFTIFLVPSDTSESTGDTLVWCKRVVAYSSTSFSAFVLLLCQLFFTAGTCTCDGPEHC